MEAQGSPAPRLASLDASSLSHVPSYSQTLFNAKTTKQLTFADIAKKLNRSEVGVAALFFGQATASEEDVTQLAQLLGVSSGWLKQSLPQFPTRGSSSSGPMPPVEPLIYRLYEVVQSYGQAIKAVINEKFGDGIMSAVAFSSKVDKETDEQGTEWVVITMRGKW
ncbi:hypothetical protein TD95_002170 [Thielaviopsis punctulata]|uniref:Cyanate hydratase n=1 Tax=Thielaviopsis punctulata TaxID=72032 RepID=A0A0F4Z6J5_9PEZI|nr:hypothetical protein TD95_002170 [Thielaviopsis punctulata]